MKYKTKKAREQRIEEILDHASKKAIKLWVKSARKLKKLGLDHLDIEERLGKAVDDI